MHIFDLKIFLLWIGMTLTHQGPIKPAMKSWPPKQILLKKGTFSSQNQPQTPASDNTTLKNGKNCAIMNLSSS